jgi:outer membrane protein assembly factor BamB
VVAGERVFLTATEGEKLLTLALERKSGRIAWRQEVTRPRAMKIYKANDGASPTPVSDGKNVYAFFPELGLISYDANGKERWRLPLGPFNTFYGMSSSPILSGNTLLLLCDARVKPFLLAVDAATGKIKWRVERKEIRFEGYTSPLLYQPASGAQQVVVLGANRIDAYAVSNGEHLWWVRGLAYFPIGSPIISREVLVASTYGSDAPEYPAWEALLKMDANGDGKLQREEMKSSADMYEHFGALDINDDGIVERDEWDPFLSGGTGNYGLVGVKLGGRGDLTESSLAWREKKTYPGMPSPLIYNDVLYIVKAGGIIASLDPATGKTLKVDRSKDALGEYYSSPVAADGKIFFVSENGKVTVVKAAPQWEILAVNDLGEETQTTPAIAGKQIFIRTHKALYAFGIK